MYYILVWPIGIGISIIKYRFLSVSPGLYSHDVFENIEEHVLVLDHGKKIIFANSNAGKLLPDTIREPDLRESIPEYDSIITEIDKLLKGSINNFVETIVIIRDDNSKFAIQAKFFLVLDKYNDRIGVLIIGHELKGIEEFTAEYKVTNREIDVIRYVKTGISNRKIGEMLDISERTVESHMANIYTKLNIKNKVELINIIKKYGFA